MIYNYHTLKKYFLALFTLCLSLSIISCNGGSSSPTPVTLTSILVTSQSVATPLGVDQQFLATGLYSNGTTANLTSSATWSSSSTANATVDTSGLVTPVAPGVSLITAALNGITSNSVTLTVTSAVLTSLAITPATPSVVVGTNQILVATGTFSDGTTQIITNSTVWSSGTLAVARFINPGVLNTLSAGITTITVSAPSLSGVLVYSTDVTVTASPLASVTITPAAKVSINGTTQQYTALATYVNGQTQDVTSLATWTSSNSAVATLSVSGAIVTALAVESGSTNISAAFGGMTGTAPMSVIPASASVIGISVSAVGTPPANLAESQSWQYKALATYSNGQIADVSSQATWSSTSAATVNSTGLVTANEVTTPTAATITATYSGNSGSTSITVVAKVAVSIQITPSNITMLGNSSQAMSAWEVFSDGSTLNVTESATWASESSSIVTMTNATPGGTVMNVAYARNINGQTSVSASYAGLTGTTNVYVNINILEILTVTPNSGYPKTSPNTLPRGASMSFSSDGTFRGGTSANMTPVTAWNSTSTGTISNDITPTTAPSGTGVYTVTVLPNAVIGDQITVNGSVPTFYTYTAVPALFTIGTAQATSITLSPTSFSLPAGTSTVSQGNVTATIHWSDGTTTNNVATTWAISGATMASTTTPGSTITVTAGNTQGMATLTASYTDPVYNNIVMASESVTVTAAIPVSGVITGDSPISIGATSPYRLTMTMSDGTTSNYTTNANTTWSSDNTGIVNIVNNTGVATGVNTGTTTIRATVNSYTGSTITPFSITVQ